MPTIEERVAYLEGQVSEHSHTLVEIRDSIHNLERRVDSRCDQLERRFEQLEGRFVQLEGRFVQLEGRFVQLEGRTDTRFEQFERRTDARFDAIDRRFEVQDDKTARQFTWLVGLHVTTLIAVVGALLARP
jgi:predicted nuclease with TOPRIM domain